MRVGELAAATGVSVRSLRYYEQQGLLESERTLAGHRVYTTEHPARVLQIQELIRAGFCSSVIRELLPALTAPERDEVLLRASFDAAQTRLESEKRSIHAELAGLQRLRHRLGLAPDTHVRREDRRHDFPTAPEATSLDHRDRRLR